ncbi:DJ-1/PfpI family protein [Pseudomonas sp. NFX15]
MTSGWSTRTTHASASSIKCWTTSPLGGTPPEDGYDESDPSQLAFRNSLAIRRMANSRKLSQVDVLDYDAIFFPGGLGPMIDIANDPDVKRAVERAWNGGKIVAAVCHGPAALLGARLEDGTPLVRGTTAPPTKRRVNIAAGARNSGYCWSKVVM